MLGDPGGTYYFCVRLNDRPAEKYVGNWFGSLPANLDLTYRVEDAGATGVRLWNHREQ
ncbi:MAG: hypothetical protein JWO39_1424 [Gemmatimonadetes bacterium]|nr:hypothetical protein [Gemmatimonadota bacterium]